MYIVSLQSPLHFLKQEYTYIYSIFLFCNHNAQCIAAYRDFLDIGGQTLEVKTLCRKKKGNDPFLYKPCQKTPSSESKTRYAIMIFSFRTDRSGYTVSELEVFTGDMSE